MENENKEKRRASNIIWNASTDYSFQSDIKAYDEDGEADLYWNYIIGAVHKYYDYSLINSTFSYLNENENYAFYENLLWIGLENCAYEKSKNERPALKNLRQSYAKNVLKKKNAANLFDEINMAHFQRALGEDPKITGLVLNVLNDLEMDESINTEQIILRINEIFKVYFKFSHSDNKENALNRMIKNRKMINFGGHRKLQFSGIPELNEIDNNFDGKKEIKHNIIAFNWLRFIEKRDKNERKYIESYFGNSIFAEKQTKVLEKILCYGNHKNCHLHFTRGEFNDDDELTIQKKAALDQREKNKKYYKENYARNINSISKLANKIKNMMLANLESSSNKSKAGKLVSGKIWRNIYLHDKKVFIKSIEDDIGDLTVDILLDASASQLYRQETIAVQGYIIAESLTRCQIPVRVYSICNIRNYMIVNLFRDFSEANNNNNIFNYNAAGFNRDGLAIRTSLHMMKDSPCKNKILIVLSDGKPNDLQSIPASGFIPAYHEYAGTAGVNDTAQEVRKGRQDGIPILAVFTGQDEDIPTAKKIYGHNIACIKTPERFADAVGVLIQNELKNL